MRPDQKFITEQLGRLSGVYGQPKDRTPELVRVMVREWFKALQSYPPEVIAAAFDAHVKTNKFWPVPAEIIALCVDQVSAMRQDVETFRKVVYPPALPEPPLSEAELAKRAAFCDQVKKSLGWPPKPFTPAFDAFAENMPKREISQAGASDALRATKAAKAAMKSAKQREAIP